MGRRTEDAVFLAGLAGGAPARFAHEDHLRMVHALYRLQGPVGLAEACERLIRTIAASQGAPDRYHETRTQAWVRLVSSAMRSNPDQSFSALLEGHAELRRKNLLDDHFSAAVLNSEQARAQHVAPDRAPLPPGVADAVR